MADLNVENFPIDELLEFAHGTVVDDLRPVAFALEIGQHGNGCGVVLGCWFNEILEILPTQNKRWANRSAITASFILFYIYLYIYIYVFILWSKNIMLILYSANVFDILLLIMINFETGMSS